MKTAFTNMNSESPFRGAHGQEQRNRPCRKICILCLVTSVLVAVVAGISIHVLQIRQSLIDSDQKYQRLWEQYQERNRTQCQCRLQTHEPNSTLETMTSENSRMDLSQTTCLKNISDPNNNVSILERKLLFLERNHSILENRLFILQSNLSAMSSDLSDQHQTQTHLRHNFTHLELKCRTLNGTKTQICQLLTSRIEKACSQDWIRNEGLCYYISTFKSSYNGANQLCSISHSTLLDINSNEEENFVNNALRGEDSSYWIGTCKAGNVTSNVVYKVNSGKVGCGECKSGLFSSCSNDKHRFICEKPAPLYPEIPEKIRDLCQKPVGPT